MNFDVAEPRRRQFLLRGVEVLRWQTEPLDPLQAITRATGQHREPCPDRCSAGHRLHTVRIGDELGHPRTGLHHGTAGARAIGKRPIEDSAIDDRRLR